MPNGWQAIIWTNGGVVYRRIHAALGLDGLNAVTVVYPMINCLLLLKWVLSMIHQSVWLSPNNVRCHRTALIHTEIRSVWNEKENIFGTTYIHLIGSTLYSEGSFVRRFFCPKPFEVAMLRRTYGPKVLYSEVPLLRKLLCSEDSIFRKAPHYMDSILRRFFSPKFI